MKRNKLNDDNVYFAEWLKEHHTGEQNSVNAKEIPGFGCPRTIRKRVHTLRREGFPICSFAGGYYYATQAPEIKKSVKFLTNMRNRLTVAVKGLTKSLTPEHNYEQLSFNFCEN